MRASLNRSCLDGSLHGLAVALLKPNKKSDAAVLVGVLGGFGKVFLFLRKCMVPAELLTRGCYNWICALNDGLVGCDKGIVECFDTLLACREWDGRG